MHVEFPKGYEFGKVVVLIDVDDPKFGTTVDEYTYGLKKLPIVLVNDTKKDYTLLEDPPPFGDNPWDTSHDYIITGFTEGQIIKAGEKVEGVVSFRPTYRGESEASIEFVTTPSMSVEANKLYLTGTGVVQAKAFAQVSLTIPQGATTGTFAFVNRGDFPLLEDSVQIEGPFEVLREYDIEGNPIPIFCPAEFKGGGTGTSVVVQANSAEKESWGSLIIAFKPNSLGHPAPLKINLLSYGD